MNINLNVPVALLERLLSAVERLAAAAERIAGPNFVPEEPKPYGPELWGTSSNALSRRYEEEDRQEAAGYGRTYQDELIAKAQRTSDSAG